MSELLGGNNEESNENEEFNFDGLDNEWAELSKSLDVTSEEALVQERNRVEFEAAQDYLFNLLIERDMPRVIDRNEDIEGDLYVEYCDNYFRNLRQELERTGDHLDEDSERQLTIACVQDYFEEREFQAMVLNNAAAFRFVIVSPESSEGQRQYMMLLKKQLQAELLIHYRRTKNDAWYKFLDEAVPGDGLDLSAPVDMAFVSIAKATLPQYNEEMRKKRRVVSEAKVIAGIDDENDEWTRVIEMTAALVNLEIIAGQPIASEWDRANRNATLWEEVRRVPVDADTAKKLVEFYDQAYPLGDRDS